MIDAGKKTGIEYHFVDKCRSARRTGLSLPEEAVITVSGLCLVVIVVFDATELVAARCMLAVQLQYSSAGEYCRVTLWPSDDTAATANTGIFRSVQHTIHYHCTIHRNSTLFQLISEPWTMSSVCFSPPLMSAISICR